MLRRGAAGLCWGKSRSRIACHPPARSADVIIVGDSRVWYGIDQKSLAKRLRIPHRKAASPRITRVAVFGLSVASDRWLWRRITCGGHVPRAKVAIIGLWEVALRNEIPTTDEALRYLYGAADLPWLLRHGRLDEAARVLTYRIFPLYARRSSLRTLVARTPSSPSFREPRRDQTLKRYRDYYRDYRIDPFQVGCLDEILADMRARGIHAILVSPPIERSLLRLAASDPRNPRWRGLPGEAAPGSPLSLFKRTARRSAARAGALYLDYLRPEQSARFAYRGGDLAHLAPHSAAAFTEEIAARINAELAQQATAPNQRPR